MIYDGVQNVQLLSYRPEYPFSADHEDKTAYSAELWSSHSINMILMNLWDEAG